MSSPQNESSMLLEIRAQGDVLARVMSDCEAEINRIADRHAGMRLHFVGCGDMYFAASQVQSLAGLMWGATVGAWRSMDLRWLHPRLNEGDLVVCASVSGRTRRTLEAALLAQRGAGHILGITDNPRSPLDDALDSALILGTASIDALENKSYAGYRNIIAQTQTFTAVWIVEMMLAAAMSATEADLAWIPGRVRELTECLDGPARTVAETFFPGGEEVVVLGSGPHWPVALYGAAKMLEFAVPATAQCIEEFNHGGAFVADEKTRIIMLATDGPSGSRGRELTEVWEKLGVQSLVLARGGEFPGEHTRVFPLPCRDRLDEMLCQVIALQLLTVWGVGVMGRDPNRWLGGRRADLVQSMSQQTIRGSQLWEPDG